MTTIGCALLAAATVAVTALTGHLGFGAGIAVGLLMGPVNGYAIQQLLVRGPAFRVRLQSREGEPTKVQAIFEWGYDQLRSLIKTNVSGDALFIIPLAMTIFLYVLIANWIEVFPLAFFPILHGANADLNQTLAMGLIVFFVVQWYSFRVLGPYGFFYRSTNPFERPCR